MRPFLRLAVLLSAPFAVSAGRAATSCPDQAGLRTQAQVERYIIASEDAWAKSVPAGNASVVRRILAEDFVWVLDGRVLDKATAVAEAADPGPFLSNGTDYVHVRVFGDTAIAQGSESWVKKGGVKGRFVWTDTWLKRGGCWRIVAAQDTTAPPAGK